MPHSRSVVSGACRTLPSASELSVLSSLPGNVSFRITHHVLKAIIMTLMYRLSISCGLNNAVEISWPDGSKQFEWFRKVIV